MQKSTALKKTCFRPGRYVGQPELMLLLEDWAAVCPGAKCEVSGDGEHMTLRGTLEMEQHLRAVEGLHGERSAAELDELARKLRDEQPITLSLDQETARTKRVSNSFLRPTRSSEPPSGSQAKQRPGTPMCQSMRRVSPPVATSRSSR